MRYIEAIDPYIYNADKVGPVGESILFLAGGITRCPDWQQTMVQLLGDTQLTLLNPRRKDFPIGDPTAAETQITWEYNALRFADAILFWFPCETLCPIVLYELGAWSLAIPNKPIFVGVHPDYSRRQDVEIQTGLVRPRLKIQYSLKDLADYVKLHFINPQVAGLGVLKGIADEKGPCCIV